MAPLALAPLSLALALDLLQAILGALDGFTDHAAVQFDLGFARAAAPADAALLALQVRPAAHQTGAEVLQARQLDLQLAFVAARALGKDFQDQQGAVVDRQADGALQVALLHRRERLVEQHFARALALRQQADLLDLAAADEQRRIGRLALAGQARHRLQAGGFGQQAQLLQLAVEMGHPQIHPDQDGGSAFRGGGTGQSGKAPCQKRQIAIESIAAGARRVGAGGQNQSDSATSPVAEKLTGRPGTMVEIACL